jgi:hypothetical protein
VPELEGDPEALAPALSEVEGESDRVGEAVGVPVALLVGVPVPEPVFVPVRLGDGVGVPESLAEPELLAVLEGDAPRVALGVGEKDTVGDAERVVEGVHEAVLVAEAVGEGVPVPVGVGAAVALPESDTEGVPEADAPALREAVGDTLTVLLPLRVVDGEAAAVPVPLPLGVPVPLVLGVGVPEAGEGVAEGVAGAEGVVEPEGVKLMIATSSSASDSGAPESGLSTVGPFVTGAAAESTTKGAGSPAAAAASLKLAMGMAPVSPIVCCRYTTLLTTAAASSASVASARAPPTPSRRRFASVLPNTYTMTATESALAPHCGAASAEQLAAGLQPVHDSSAAHAL